MSLCDRRTLEGKERRRLLQDDVSCYSRRGRGSEEEGASGDRHVYGAVTIVGQMGYTVGHRWWGEHEGEMPPITLCCAGSGRRSGM